MFFDESPYSLSTKPDSPFLNLAREIRDQIYDELLKGAKYSTQKGGPDITLVYGGCVRGRPAKLPLWLLTCKQVFSESMSQYYRKAKCNRLVGTDEPYEEVTPFRVLSLYRVHELDFDDCLEVMVPRTKDNVNQNGSYTLTTEATNRWGRTAGFPIEKLSMHLKGYEHHIKVFKLTISLPEASA